MRPTPQFILPKKSLMKNFCAGYHWKSFALAVTAFITNLCVIVCIKSPFTQSSLQWETSSFFNKPKKSLNWNFFCAIEVLIL